MAMTLKFTVYLQYYKLDFLNLVLASALDYLWKGHRINAVFDSRGYSTYWGMCYFFNWILQNVIGMTLQISHSHGTGTYAL